jgi:hypothetical protein
MDERNALILVGVHVETVKKVATLRYFVRGLRIILEFRCWYME